MQTERSTFFQHAYEDFGDII